MSKKIEACPTQSGTCIGYTIEVKNSDGIWKPMSISEIPTGGVIRDDMHPDVLNVLGLYGHDSATALAWMFKANHWKEALHGVRIIPHKVDYDIKAYKSEEQAIQIGDKA